MSKSVTLGDGTIARIGDEICFKRDVEQSGIVVSIRGGMITLEPPAGEPFAGGYIGGDDSTTEEADQCWTE